MNQGFYGFPDPSQAAAGVVVKQVLVDVRQVGSNANITHTGSFGAYPNTPTMVITLAAPNDIVRWALDYMNNSTASGGSVQFRVKMVGSTSGGTVYATFDVQNTNGTFQNFHSTADSPALAQDTYTCTLEFITAGAGFYVRPATASTGEWLSLAAFEYHN